MPHISDVTNTWLSLSDLFHSAWCLPSPSMLPQMAKFHFFNGYFSVCVYICVCIHKRIHIYLCTHTTSSLSIHLVHGHRLLPHLGNCQSCCFEFLELVVFFLYVSPGVEFLIFWEASILFSIGAAPIYISLSRVWRFPFLCILANTCYLCSFWWQSLWQVWSDTSLWFWFPWW